MDKSIKVALVGIGGYGKNYLNILLNDRHEKGIRFVGAIDPYFQNSEKLPEIRAQNVPLFKTLEEFYEDNTADLVVISSPIQYHCPQTCLALSQGSHVLCEKPLSATTEEGIKMLKAQKKVNKLVEIGYQWSFSEGIQDLKNDIMKGLYGKPKRLKTLILWPRTHKYFNSGAWRGQKKDSEGNWILDSVANNATAHYLHNMLYILGEETKKSIMPKRLIAETYCANDIETFDTVALRVFTEKNIEILYVTAHAINKFRGPEFVFEFENGKVTFEKDMGMVGHMEDGSKKNYTDPNSNMMAKFEVILDNIKAGVDKEVCGIEASLAHTLCINGLEESVPKQVRFPEEIIKIGQFHGNRGIGTWVEGLYDILIESYDKWLLPSELGVEWAKLGNEVIFKDEM